MKNLIFILIFGLLAIRIVGQQNERLYYPDRFTGTQDTILDPFSLKKMVETKGVETRLDSIYEFDWSIGNSVWIKTYGTFHNYNQDQNRINTIGKIWINNPGKWQNNLLQEYFYNDKDNKIKDVVKAWSGSALEWINFSQRLFSFNEMNNLTGYVVQEWDGIQLSWGNSIQYLYDYDEEQNWIYYERQDWNSDSLKWELNYRFIFTYETGLKKDMLRQNWNHLDSAWINSTKNSYWYNESESLIEEIQYVWQTQSSDWKESTKISLVRDQSDLVSEKIYQAWITDVWKNTTMYTYQYSSQGKESEYVYYTWNNETWNKNDRHLYEYDEPGVLTREIDQEWQISEEIWTNDYKWEYFYTFFGDPLQVFITDSTNVSCYGYSDGTATVTISGGTPPYSILWNDLQNTTDATVFGLSADQYYTVTVTDADMNSAIDSVILSQPPEIITGSIFGDANVNQNDTVTYWVESDASAIYSWFVINGQIISVAAGDSVIVLWPQSGQGKVSVIESNLFGCEGDTVHLNVSISSTGIDKKEIPTTEIYPNPANQFVIIRLDEEKFDTWDLVIYDMTGKIIRSFHSLSERRYRVSLDQMGRGIYFFKITTSTDIKIQKVVIEK